MTSGGGGLSGIAGRSEGSAMVAVTQVKRPPLKEVQGDLIKRQSLAFMNVVQPFENDNPAQLFGRFAAKRISRNSGEADLPAQFCL